MTRRIMIRKQTVTTMNDFMSLLLAFENFNGEEEREADESVE